MITVRMPLTRVAERHLKFWKRKRKLTRIMLWFTAIFCVYDVCDFALQAWRGSKYSMWGAVIAFNVMLVQLYIWLWDRKKVEEQIKGWTLFLEAEAEQIREGHGGTTIETIENL